MAIKSLPMPKHDYTDTPKCIYMLSHFRCGSTQAGCGIRAQRKGFQETQKIQKCSLLFYSEFQGAGWPQTKRDMIFCVCGLPAGCAQA